MWLSVYPNMKKENFIPFDQFKAKVIRPHASYKTKEEIEAEFEKVIKAYEKGR